jgi:hypothetical protein
MGYALEGCFPKQSVSSLTLHGVLAAGQYTYTYTPRAESPPKEGPPPHLQLEIAAEVEGSCIPRPANTIPLPIQWAQLVRAQHGR